jgi:hypothetical protein
LLLRARAIFHFQEARTMTQDSQKPARPRGRWWRAYDEALSEPKLQQLPPELFKDWFNLLCVASESGGKLPDLDTVAFKLRKTPKKMHGNLACLINAGLFDVGEDGTIAPHNWESRQYKFDNSTERVRRFRENKADAETFHETTNETFQ